MGSMAGAWDGKMGLVMERVVFGEWVINNDEMRTYLLLPRSSVRHRAALHDKCYAVAGFDR